MKLREPDRTRTPVAGGELMFATEQSTFHGKSETATQLQRILVPIDFTRRCADTATFAVNLARRFRARVTLLHVEKFFAGDPYTTEDVRWVRRQMASFLPQSTEDPNVWRTIHANPNIADEILSTAIEIRADLIVMPTHGYGIFRKALMGSVTAGVLKHAPCPVWTTAHTTPTPMTEWLNPQRILCAVDSLPKGAAALSWASRLASELDVEFCVAWSQNVLTEMRREIERAGWKYHIDAETLIAAGDAPNTLRRAVEEMRADLLVVDRNSWKSPAELNPDTYRIVREAPCPVVSI